MRRESRQRDQRVRRGRPRLDRNKDAFALMIRHEKQPRLQLVDPGHQDQTRRRNRRHADDKNDNKDKKDGRSVFSSSTVAQKADVVKTASSASTQIGRVSCRERV